MENTLATLKPILLVEVSDDVLENSPIKSADIIDYLEMRNYVRRGIGMHGNPVELNAAESLGYHNYAFFPKR